MNVKLNSSELYCLLGDEYERIHSTLKRNLNLDFDVFAERSVGYGYLQWNLPGDGWQPLSQCPPARRGEIDNKVSTIRDQITGRFGTNVEMAQRVLSTPDDNEFVYFREDSFGQVAICFVAWGYKRPEQVSTTDIHIVSAPKGATERVSVTIYRDGQALPGYPFELNGYQRRTGSNGSFFIGRVEVGQKFNIAVDGVMNEYTVTAGEGDIKIYLASVAAQHPAEAVAETTPPVVPPVIVEEKPTVEPPAAPVVTPPTPEVKTPVPDKKKETDGSKNWLNVLSVICFFLLMIASYIAGYYLLKN